MAKYEFKGPDGGTYQIEAPDDVPAREVMGFVEKQFSRNSKPEVSVGESLGRGALQGVTLGFGDEIYGAAKGAYDKVLGSGDFSGTYATERDAVRAANDKARDANPATYFAGELAGGVAIPGAAARVATKLPAAASRLGSAAGFGATQKAANLGLGARAMAASREAGAYGAAYGLGTGEGSLEDQALSTLGGYAGGRVVGAALPGAVDLASAGARRVAAPVRGYMNPDAVGAEKLAEAMARDVGASGTASDVASGMSRIQARAAAAADDPTMMVGDLGGENTRALLRQARNMPNDNTQRFVRRVDQRQSFQPNRLERSSQATLGDGQEFMATADDLVKTRSANAEAAYEPAYAVPLPKGSPADAEISSFFDSRKYMGRLLEKTIENLQGVSGKTVNGMRPWEILHRVKMQINKEVGNLKRGMPDNKAGWDVKDLTTLNREYQALLAKHNRRFGNAQKQFSDESGLINALEDGLEDFNKIQPEEIARKVRSMASDEAEMYRLGAQRALVEKVRRGNVTGDKTETAFSSREMQLKLRAIFKDTKSLRLFQRDLIREARKADTRKSLAGSQTDRNLVNASEAGAPARAVSTAQQLARGNVLEPAAAFLGRAANRVSGLNPSSAESILEMALQPAGEGLSPQIINALNQASSLPSRRAALSNRLAIGAAAAQPANALFGQR